MKEYSIEYISELTKKVNKNREDLYKTMKWGTAPKLSEGDVRMVLEARSET